MDNSVCNHCNAHCTESRAAWECAFEFYIHDKVLIQIIIKSEGRSVFTSTLYYYRTCATTEEKKEQRHAFTVCSNRPNNNNKKETYKIVHQINPLSTSGNISCILFHLLFYSSSSRQCLTLSLTQHLIIKTLPLSSSPYQQQPQQLTEQRSQPAGSPQLSLLLCTLHPKALL